MYRGHAKRIEVSAVRMGLAPAISAAAKADSATGGVIMDNTPKYNTNICAHISVIPASIRVGAATIATSK